jgi:hypothetical protein
LALGASTVKREAEEGFALGASTVKCEAEEGFALGVSTVKREAEEELALKNSAPTSVPRRHLTHAGRPLLLDRIKVNEFGRMCSRKIEDLALPSQGTL